MSQTPQVRPGQVWQSRDRRETRYVCVMTVSAGYVTAVRCGIDGKVYGSTRRTRINRAADGTIARYRLVRDAEGGEPR